MEGCARRGYRSEVEWRELVEKWEESGERAAEFCRREGLHVSLFYKWRRKLGEVGGIRFVELKARRAAGVRVHIECGRGRRVVVEGLTLREVLAEVEGA
jgi:transposase-like protein